MELLCLGIALLAAVLAAALTPATRGIALRVGFVDRPGGRKMHAAPTAYGGGLAVAAALSLALVGAAWLWRSLLHDPSWRQAYAALGLDQYAREVKLGGQASLFRALLCCAAAAAGALLLGLADDRRPLKWPVKIAAQTLLAAAAVAGGVRLTALVGDTLFMQAVTVLWIVLVTNSFNLLDNMDGLCAGTAAIAALALSLVAAASGQAALALTLSALAGACLGFLVWNLAPARIFLGDAGSQFIGFLIACLSVLVTYYHYRESPLSLALPFLILAVPLYDTVSVVAVRLKERRHPLLGDTSHFSHRLVALGLSRRQAVATIHLAALATALPALAIRELPVRTGLLLAGQAFLILGLIAMLEYAGWKRVRGPVSLTAHPELPPPSTETQDGVPPADASV